MYLKTQTAARTIRLFSLVLTSLAAAAASPEDLLEKPDDWFGTAEGKKAAINVLSWQASEGSWPKNKDTSDKIYTGKADKLEGTFDNKATTGELRFLARAFRVTGDMKCRDAVIKGFDHILDAQYPNGGWPQFHPPGEKYHRHITFNDGTMVRLLEFLKDSTGSDEFSFLGPDRRRAATAAFDRGVECILKCQIVLGGNPTVWCAQHDELTFAPAKARDYELPSLSGCESAGILRFLMDLEKPSPAVIRAVKGGVAWFDSAKITGYRYAKSGKDRVIVKDPGAPPLWARFYDLETGKPFFCDRDGIKKDSVDQIGAERRNGYAWYGNWGESVAKDFAKWPHR
jgi:PelA/Pel-15E family pectate lyase